MKRLFDNVISVFVVVIVLFLLIPLPPFLLDVFLIINISLALIILLITMNIHEPLEFSIFPSLLLITTLFRLGLNVSSTRLILSRGGDAGQVIKAFGEFVIQGNVVIGVIIFLIIVLMQFIVITKGAERVAEVAARFTLDSMPGKQMAIDADLSSGLINEQEAKLRRNKIQRESDFYGAMDGATKIVKGDAIMSIIITSINFIAGSIIGIVQSGMGLSEVLSVYSIATIGDGLVSQLPALMISTASRVGTGNIVGVSTAICLGGYGAVFWMWVTAILGGASAFVESTLAQIYKRKNKDGSSYGGPSYYMETALRQRWLGVVFAIIIILTYAVGYNMLASYNLQSAFAGFSFYGDHSPFLIGLILAVLFAACVLGGAHRLTKVTGTLVPIMGVLYVVIALVVVLMHLNLVPTVFQNIFASAFDFPAIFGGFAGSCMMEGIKRGLYSNEAGMGSAPNAAATADVSHPVKQGLVQMLSVFIDTILICSATALMCLCSGVEPTAEAAGAPYVQAALQNALGDFGPVFIAISMALFAFTTLIGNYYYCEGCLRFIFKKTPSQTFMTVFRIIAAVIVLLGAVISMQLAWDTADLFQALMVVINIPVILILGRTAIKALKDYTEQRKAGKNPEFKAANIGLKEKTDYWN